MDDKIALKVEHVSKSFKLPNERSSGLKNAFINWTRGIKGYTVQHVLRDISFTVNKGDFFGIVGRNGSGKSTLLKIISQIYQPNHGKIEVNGFLVPFIELGVGFNPELTGRENVFLNGAMLGFSREEMDEMYDDIVDFAELHDFMNQKLKNYSSGMQVRLAFSVAIKARGDILVLDEVLAVGDEAFQKKCNQYFYDAKRNGRTIVLVTHDMGAVRQFCNKAILIKDGEIAMMGKPDKVANAYSNMFIDEAAGADQHAAVKKRKWPLQLSKVSVLQGGRPKRTLNFGEEFAIDVSFRSNKAYPNANLSIQMIDQAARTILATSTKPIGDFNIHKGDNDVQFTIDNIFTDGDYYINLTINDESKDLLYEERELKTFSILGAEFSKYSLTHPKVRIAIDGHIQK